MSNVTVNIGATQDDGTGDSLRSSFDKINKTIDGSNRTSDGASTAVRYVATWGDNSNDGLTWETSKRSVADAVLSLPVKLPSSRFSHYTGAVYIGSGEFVETQAIPAAADIQLIGHGPRPGGFSDEGEGTWIGLGYNGDLIYDSLYTSWNQMFRIEHMTLDGNGRTGDYDLLRFWEGGFNCEFSNVFFRGAPRYGVHQENHLGVNCYFYDCTWGSCTSAGVYCDMPSSGNPSSLGFFGAQADNCGPSWLVIDDASNGGDKHVFIMGLETEAFSSDTQHKYIVDYRPQAGGGACHFHLTNIGAYHDSSDGTAIIHEANTGGSRGAWILTNIHGGTYQEAFLSSLNSASGFGAKTAGATGHLPFAILSAEAGGGTGNESELQLHNVLFISGAGSPEGSKAAPKGSLYLNESGGASTVLYVKEVGSGNTGWVAK